MPPPRHQRIGNSRAELAVAHYLAHGEQYVIGVTFKSEREAAAFLATGAPGNGIGGNWAQVKSDATGDRLRAYRQRLRELAKSGAYDGPVELTRLRPNGSWGPLRLPDDRP